MKVRRIETAIDPDTPPIEQMAMEDIEAAIASQGAIRSGKLAGKSMWSAIWILALPVLLQQLMASCVGLVDKVLAGNLPKAIVLPALGAIGIGSYVAWFIGIAMAGLGVGGQALIARAIGAGDAHQSGRALGQAITLSFLWGALVGVGMWISAGPLAAMCGLEGQSRLFCVQYVHMIALAMPCTGIMSVGAMCMFGAGETLRPSLIAVLMNVFNILFAWMLSGANVQFYGHVLENPFPFNWAVRGIGAGTALCYVFGAALTLAILIRGVKDLRLEARHLVPDQSMCWRIVYLGVPNFFEGLAMWGVSLIVLVFIGNIAKLAGDDASGLQGAHIIAVQWESLSFLPGFAMGTAAGALAGQYLGAGNQRMAHKSVLACTSVACIIMGVLGVLFMTEGRFLTSIISHEQVHLEHTPNLLATCGKVQVFFAIAMVLRQALRGAGDAIWPFLLTSASSYLVRLPLAWYLGVHLRMGIEGIWYGLCGELVIRSALFAARFFHGGWKSLRV